MMQKMKLTVRGAGFTLAVPIAIVSLAALVLGGAAVSSFAQQADAQEAEPLLIEVTLDEYSFAPEPLRIPAGREVTLVIRNVGEYAHEFMAGRDAEGNDFKQDLFADLHVNIEPVEMPAGDHQDHTAAETASEDAASGDHTHDAEHAHGTMVENQPGETFLMTFTLPESRRGEWTTGCFLRGHYERGMHGTLIVE